MNVIFLHQMFGYESAALTLDGDEFVPFVVDSQVPLFLAPLGIRS